MVLVVDDCECVRAAIKIILREWEGFCVVTATTSEEALDLAQRYHFEVVTSDIRRSGMDGLEFLRVFKKAHPRTPVIIASGVMDEATARQAKWLRAFGCLPKPFTVGEFVALVRAAIASKRMCQTLMLSSRRDRRIPV